MIGEKKFLDAYNKYHYANKFVKWWDKWIYRGNIFKNRTWLWWTGAIMFAVWIILFFISGATDIKILSKYVRTFLILPFVIHFFVSFYAIPKVREKISKVCVELGINFTEYKDLEEKYLWKKK